MKPVGLIGRGGGRIAPEALNSIDALMRVSGGNIGNFAFWAGARSILGPETRNIAARLPTPPDIGALVIPAANWLNPVSDFGWLADFVEAVDVPTVILGLGAQNDRDDQFPAVPDGTLRLLEAVSRRSPYLGVRGEYTAKLCRHLGFPKVRVLGCPSIFLNREPHLGEEIARRWHADCTRIASHGFSVRPRARAAERFLFALVRGSDNGSFVLQAPREILALHLDARTAIPADAPALREQFAPGLDDAEFVETLRRRAWLPTSIDAWLEHLRGCSHSLNTRIHGSLMSLAAGRPAVCFTHDTRTVELADTLLVPAVDAGLIDAHRTPADILHGIAFDGAAFDDNRARLARAHLDLFRDAGIPVAETLRALAGS